MHEKQTTASPQPDCSTDPAGSLKQMFVDMTMGPRIKAGQDPVRRAVFLKPHGIAKADFIMLPGLEEKYRVGIFAHERFEAWLRFSSDTVPGNPDQKTTVGVGIKLYGVPGRKVLPGDEHATTADFLLQNMNIFFVDTATDMCEFTRAGVVDHDYDTYLNAHPETKRILAEMQKNVNSCLTIPYWSALPYSFGENRYVKYMLQPVPPPYGAPARQYGSDYLAIDLQARLSMAEAQFQFMVQFSTDPEKTPLDKATVPWDSPFIPLATIVIRKQDIGAQGQAEYGENLSFNPWRTLEVHQPQGSLGEARKVVYQAGASLRRNKNGIPEVEPQTPRNI